MAEYNYSGDIQDIDKDFNHDTAELKKQKLDIRRARFYLDTIVNQKNILEEKQLMNKQQHQQQ
jgi:hypothetical protein